MGHRTNIPHEELVRVAHALASGQNQAQLAKELEWDTNKMRRCVARMALEISGKSERRSLSMATDKALEWLRLGDLCTPDELDKAKERARQEALEYLESTLKDCARWREWGMHDDAERHYLRYLRLDPDNVEVRIAHGHCLMEMGRLGDALERLRPVFVDNPEHAIRHFESVVRTRDQRAMLKELEGARQIAPENNLHILAFLGVWLMGNPTLNIGARGSPGRIAVVKMLNETTTSLVRQYAGKDGYLHQYCRIVADIVVFGLWEHGHTDDAVAVARTAQQQGWYSFNINSVLETAVQRHLFLVLVQVSSDKRPGHWPENTLGYQQTVEVIARDADEARTAALEHMQRNEPSSVKIKVEDVRQQGEKRESSIGTTVFFHSPSWLYRKTTALTVTRRPRARGPTRRRRSP